MSLLKVRVGGSRYLCKWDPHSNEVKIGDRWYPYVQIGRQLWITENLDWKLNGIDIGGTLVKATPNAWYYNNDEPTYGINGNKYGLLYNIYCLDLIQGNLPNGWRVPNYQDISKLIAIPRSDLASQSWLGTNSTGFNAIPSGRMGSAHESAGSPIVDFSFMGESTYFFFWSSAYAGKMGSLDTYYHFQMDSSNVTENNNYSEYGLSIRLCKDATVNIGGRDYPTTRIGNQIWMAENLDWKLDGITIGASGDPTTPSAWYYNNDEATYGVNGNKYGLLYNWYSINIITQALRDGWRIPTSNDFNTLGEYASGLSNAGTKLKSTSGWEPLPNFPSPNGTDDYGFSGLPSGLRVSGSFNYATNYSFYLTTTESSNENFSRAGLSVNTDLAIQPLRKDSGCSIRLVKDAT